jgi:hypothetical protein
VFRKRLLPKVYSTHCINEEASYDRIPAAGMWLSSVFVWIAAINLLKVTLIIIFERIIEVVYYIYLPATSENCAVGGKVEGRTSGTRIGCRSAVRLGILEKV